MIALLRNNRVGFQLPGLVSITNIIQPLFRKTLDCYYYKSVFAYPLDLLSISYSTFENNTFPKFPHSPSWDKCRFFTIDTSGLVRITIFKLVDSDFVSYSFVDLDPTHETGYVVMDGENTNIKETLMGLMMAGASESLINDKVYEHKLGSNRPFLWFDVQEIVDNLVSRNNISSTQLRETPKL